jgi:hypothetical protein
MLPTDSQATKPKRAAPSQREFGAISAKRPVRWNGIPCCGDSERDPQFPLRQNEQRQQVTRLVKDERGSATCCSLPPLADHGQAGFVHRAGRSRRRGPPAQQQAGNVGYQSLSGLMKKAILRASSLKFLGSTLYRNGVFAGVFHLLASLFLALR